MIYTTIQIDIRTRKRLNCLKTDRKTYDQF